MQIVADDSEIELRDGSLTHVTGLTSGQLCMGDLSSTELFCVLPMTGMDLVIGRKWLYKHNPHLDWMTAFIRVTGNDGTTHNIRPRTTSRPKTVVTQTISIKSMRKLVRRRKAELFAVRVRPTTD